MYKQGAAAVSSRKERGKTRRTNCLCLDDDPTLLELLLLPRILQKYKPFANKCRHALPLLQLLEVHLGKSRLFSGGFSLHLAHRRASD